MANFEKHSGKILPPNVTVKKNISIIFNLLCHFFIIFQNITLYTNIFLNFGTEFSFTLTPIKKCLQHY